MLLRLEIKRVKRQEFSRSILIKKEFTVGFVVFPVMAREKFFNLLKLCLINRDKPLALNLQNIIISNEKLATGNIIEQKETNKVLWKY